MENTPNTSATHWIGGVIGAGLSVAIGVGLLWFGQSVQHASYDLPLALGKTTPQDEALIIYLDSISRDQLHQPADEPWDRALHARLVERLTEAKARAVVGMATFWAVLFNTMRLYSGSR